MQTSFETPATDHATSVRNELHFEAYDAQRRADLMKAAGNLLASIERFNRVVERHGKTTCHVDSHTTVADIVNIAQSFLPTKS